MTIIPFRKPTTDTDAFIERVEAELASYEAMEANRLRRKLMAAMTLDEMIVEAEHGSLARMIAAAEFETTVALISAALKRGDVDGALRLCIGQ